MPYCAWERKDFDDTEFIPYRGSVLLHKAMLGFHLTTGELVDNTVDLPDAVRPDIAAYGQADMPSDAEEEAGNAGDPVE